METQKTNKNNKKEEIMKWRKVSRIRGNKNETPGNWWRQVPKQQLGHRLKAGFSVLEQEDESSHRASQQQSHSGIHIFSTRWMTLRGILTLLSKRTIDSLIEEEYFKSKMDVVDLDYDTWTLTFMIQINREDFKF